MLPMAPIGLPIVRRCLVQPKNFAEAPLKKVAEQPENFAALQKRRQAGGLQLHLVV
jgi:hypothetical protein